MKPFLCGHLLVRGAVQTPPDSLEKVMSVVQRRPIVVEGDTVEEEEEEEEEEKECVEEAKEETKEDPLVTAARCAREDQRYHPRRKQGQSASPRMKAETESGTEPGTESETESEIE